MSCNLGWLVSDLLMEMNQSPVSVNQATCDARLCPALLWCDWSVLSYSASACYQWNSWVSSNQRRTCFTSFDSLLAAVLASHGRALWEFDVLRNNK